MQVTRLGRRYAKSLLELSIEMGKLEEVKSDIDRLLTVIKESRDFRLFTQSPVINSDIKIKTFDKLFGDTFNELTFNFIQIITRKGREAHLGSIAEGFQELYRKHKGIEKAVVTTAIPLSDQQKEELKQKLNLAVGKSIIIEEKIDPTVIGGMTLRVGDKQYNGSIAHQLNMLRRQFKSNLYIKDF